MIEKLKFIVKEICKQNKDSSCVRIIENSDFIYVPYRVRPNLPTLLIAKYDLLLKVNPTIYIEQVNDVGRVSGIIKYYMNMSSDVLIEKIDIKPDYDQIAILNSEISIIETSWNEINELQKSLILSIKRSNDSIDYQNIGNTTRTIMLKLAKEVFNPQFHKAPKNVDVSNGKFKNQLHTFIASVLKSSDNKELKKFTESAIEFTENGIDLMNQTTHKLDVKKHFAEACVISTISVISLIKAVSKIEGIEAPSNSNL